MVHSVDLYNYCLYFSNFIESFSYSIFTTYSALQFFGVARPSNVEDKLRDCTSNKRVSKFERRDNFAENMVAPTRIEQGIRRFHQPHCHYVCNLFTAREEAQHFHEQLSDCTECLDLFRYFEKLLIN